MIDLDFTFRCPVCPAASRYVEPAEGNDLSTFGERATTAAHSKGWVRNGSLARPFRSCPWAYLVCPDCARERACEGGRWEDLRPKAASS